VAWWRRVASRRVASLRGRVASCRCVGASRRVAAWARRVVSLRGRVASCRCVGASCRVAAWASFGGVIVAALAAASPALTQPKHALFRLVLWRDSHENKVMDCRELHAALVQPQHGVPRTRLPPDRAAPSKRTRPFSAVCAVRAAWERLYQREKKWYAPLTRTPVPVPSRCVETGSASFGAWLCRCVTVSVRRCVAAWLCRFLDAAA
jgi:hypothetical protein